MPLKISACVALAARCRERASAHSRVVAANLSLACFFGKSKSLFDTANLFNLYRLIIAVLRLFSEIIQLEGRQDIINTMNILDMNPLAVVVIRSDCLFHSAMEWTRSNQERSY